MVKNQIFTSLIAVLLCAAVGSYVYAYEKRLDAKDVTPLFTATPTQAQTFTGKIYFEESSNGVDENKIGVYNFATRKVTQLINGTEPIVSHGQTKLAYIQQNPVSGNNAAFIYDLASG
jgi:hypothetical protein